MKSQGLGFLLTFVFGPLGLLYSSMIGAVILIPIAILIALFTIGVGAFLLWPICWIVSFVGIMNHNKRVDAKEDARHQEIVDAVRSKETKSN